MLNKQNIIKPSSKSKKKRSIWSKQIDRLESYCKKKKWTVDFTTAKVSAEDDMAWPIEKKLLIRKDRKPEITFYYFLHEIGHMLVWNKKDYDETYSHSEKYKPESQIYRVAEVEEEYEAWRAGLKLAKRLKLRLNRATYEKIKARCIISYFIFALDRKLKKIINEEKGI